MIETQLANGNLTRLRHGVYIASVALPEEPGARHLVRARAELVANPDARSNWCFSTPPRVSS